MLISGSTHFPFQLEVVVTCPFAGHLWEEPGTIFSILFFSYAKAAHRFVISPSPLQAEGSQMSQHPFPGQPHLIFPYTCSSSPAALLHQGPKEWGSCTEFMLAHNWKRVHAREMADDPILGLLSACLQAWPNHKPSELRFFSSCMSHPSWQGHQAPRGDRFPPPWVWEAQQAPSESETQQRSCYCSKQHSETAEGREEEWQGKAKSSNREATRFRLKTRQLGRYLGSQVQGCPCLPLAAASQSCTAMNGAGGCQLTWELPAQPLLASPEPAQLIPALIPVPAQGQAGRQELA